ncbi:hypothetical protein F4808DRAFT_39232 [Astrocystis sublimbata]|nr:hypothetical protein F4808DRAFT_39232 [Astrocystis sublimbata]
MVSDADVATFPQLSGSSPRLGFCFIFCGIRFHYRLCDIGRVLDANRQGTRSGQRAYIEHYDGHLTSPAHAASLDLPRTLMETATGLGPPMDSTVPLLFTMALYAYHWKHLSSLNLHGISSTSAIARLTWNPRWALTRRPGTKFCHNLGLVFLHVIFILVFPMLGKQVRFRLQSVSFLLASRISKHGPQDGTDLLATSELMWVSHL